MQGPGQRDTGTLAVQVLESVLWLKQREQVLLKNPLYFFIVVKHNKIHHRNRFIVYTIRGRFVHSQCLQPSPLSRRGHVPVKGGT